MTAMRRYARLALVLFTVLFMLAVVVEFLTVGFGLFGATSLESHEDMGSVTLVLSILAFLAALAAWIGRGALVLSFLIAALTAIEVSLPNVDSDWIAGLHPLNALVLFLLAYVLLQVTVAALPVPTGRRRPSHKR